MTYLLAVGKGIAIPSLLLVIAVCAVIVCWQFTALMRSLNGLEMWRLNLDIRAIYARQQDDKRPAGY